MPPKSNVKSSARTTKAKETHRRNIERQRQEELQREEEVRQSRAQGGHLAKRKAPEGVYSQKSVIFLSLTVTCLGHEPQPRESWHQSSTDPQHIPGKFRWGREAQRTDAFPSAQEDLATNLVPQPAPRITKPTWKRKPNGLHQQAFENEALVLLGHPHNPNKDAVDKESGINRSCQVSHARSSEIHVSLDNKRPNKVTPGTGGPNSKGITVVQQPPVEWEPPAHLVPHPEGGRYIRINNQNTRVRSVIQRAMDISDPEIVFLNAYPDHRDMIVSTRNALVQAVREYKKQYPSEGYDKIKKRIQHDRDFMERMGGVVINRFSNTRSHVKKIADTYVLGYDLGNQGNSTDIRAQVKTLLDADSYCYPGTWEVLPNYQYKRHMDRHKPYLVQPIIATMRHLCSGYKADQHLDQFGSSMETLPQEKEVPPGLVALAATAIFASLCDWQTGTLQHVVFNSGNYHTTFNGHMQYLEGVCDNYLGQYH
ncbi:hypothetical protein VNI00_016037 [Paramarasmius palmivorus]|uniref:DUF6532 domain-containing protein n=1 Tax=Paramarasmius palmivorus TaxID=297713 RepID=A0AAW0BHC7_9AGAR